MEHREQDACLMEHRERDAWSIAHGLALPPAWRGPPPLPRSKMEPPVSQRRRMAQQPPPAPASVGLRAREAQAWEQVAQAQTEKKRLWTSHTQACSRHSELSAQAWSLRAQAAGAENDAATVGMLSLDAHLLASIAALLSVSELGGLALVCRRFSLAGRTIARCGPASVQTANVRGLRFALTYAEWLQIRPAEGADEPPGSVAQATSIVDEAARLAVAARPQRERDAWPRQPGQPWLRVLGVLLRGSIWSRYSVAGYKVSHGGARITANAEWGSPCSGRAALATTTGGVSMVVGGDGAGAVHYAEFENLCRSAYIGVGRPGLDVNRPDASEMEEFWGVDWDGSGGWMGVDWDAESAFGQGDTMGLLLDCGAGRLVVYKNGARLGVAVTGLTGELCWAVAMNRQGDSVRIMGKPPPALQ
jgi:hypothetical protein